MSTPIFRFSILILILCFQVQSFAQMEFWTVGTGKTIPQSQLEVSLFRPARYGLTKTLELSAQPWAFVVFPNGQVKKNWYDRKISVATVHGLNYPTMFLNMVRKRDMEEYIPVDSIVPQLFVIKNEVIVSKMLQEGGSTCENPENYLLSLKLGIQFALNFGESTLPHIYKPVIYHRSEVYHKKVLWYVGADLDAHLNGFINYSVDVDFLSDGFIDDWAIEHKGLLMTKITSSLMVVVGYKLSYGTYREGDGTDFGIYPLADISWTYRFKKRKEKQLDLFRDGKRY
jgi:hypothetical protein